MKLLRLLGMGAIGVVCFCAEMEQRTNKENMVRDRGQTAVRGDTLQFGRPTPASEDRGPVTIEGILVDGGCQNLANMNLERPAESLAAEYPAQPANAAANNPPVSGAVSAKGITVDASTIKAERADIGSREPGMYERQVDPTCAVTGSTTSFALLTNNGSLLDLDEGGNTLALEVVQSSAAGRAMLNGAGPGVKPNVIVKGRIRNDGKLIAMDVASAG